MSDEYAPRLWKCRNKRCGAVLGVVVRSPSHVRSLNVFSRAMLADEVTLDGLDVLAPVNYLVLSLEAGKVFCSRCHSLRVWDVGRDALVEMFERRKARMVEGET